MPISTIGDRRKNLLDKLLEIRDYAAAAISATASTTGLELNLTKQMGYEVVCGVAAYTGYDDGVAEWSLSVSVSADNSAWTVATAVKVLDGTAQELRFALTGAAVNDLVANAAYIRVDATKTGTPGTLSYGAYVTPV